MDRRKQMLFMKTVGANFGGTFDCFRYFCRVFFCKRIKKNDLKTSSSAMKACVSGNSLGNFVAK